MTLCFSTIVCVSSCPWCVILRKQILLLFVQFKRYLSLALKPSRRGIFIFGPLPFAPFKNCLSSRYVTVWHLSRSYLKKNTAALFIYLRTIWFTTSSTFPHSFPGVLRNFIICVSCQPSPHCFSIDGILSG